MLTMDLIGTPKIEVQAATSSVLSKSQAIALLKNGRKAIDTVFTKGGSTPPTKNQIYSIMQPYFSQKYIEDFIKKDLVQKGSKWIVVPHGAVYVYALSYNVNLKVTYSKDKTKTYISERNYDDYEGDYVTQKLVLVKTKSGWRINEFNSDAKYTI
jgi:hypothetical protein